MGPKGTVVSPQRTLNIPAEICRRGGLEICLSDCSWRRRHGLKTGGTMRPHCFQLPSADPLRIAPALQMHSIHLNSHDPRSCQSNRSKNRIMSCVTNAVSFSNPEFSGRFKCLITWIRLMHHHCCYLNSSPLEVESTAEKSCIKGPQSAKSGPNPLWLIVFAHRNL